MTKFIYALAFGAVGLPATAGAWEAENRLTVNPVKDGVFEVVGRPGSAGAEFWCAAGDYALRVLDAGADAPVYIVRARGTPVTSDRKSGVQFSLSAPTRATPASSLFLSMRNVGDSLNVAFARSYCVDNWNLEY